MSRQKNELFTLIKSLTPQEKTFFKAYSLKNRENESTPAFLLLFDVMNGMETYDSALLQEQLRKKGFKANYFKIQTYLTEAVLKALEDYHSETESTLRVSKLLSQAQLLLKKNMSESARKYVQRARKVIDSGSFHEYRLLADHIDFTTVAKDKKSLHSYQVRVKKDLKDFEMETELRLLGIKALEHALDYFDRQVPVSRIKDEVHKTLSGLKTIFKNLTLTHFSKSRYFNSMVQCLLVLQDQKALNKLLADYISYVEGLGNKSPFLIRTALHGYNSILIAQIHTQQFIPFEQTFSASKKYFEAIPGKLRTPDICTLFYSYIIENGFASYNETGQPDKSLLLWEQYKKEIQRYNRKNTGSLYQINLAYAAFLSGDLRGAIRVAQKVELDMLRPAAFCQARLLIALAHYDLENTDILLSQINQAKKSFEKYKIAGHREMAVLDFLRKNGDGQTDRQTKFKELYQQIASINKNGSTKQVPGSIDLESWVKSKVDKSEFVQEVQKRAAL